MKPLTRTRVMALAGCLALALSAASPASADLFDDDIEPTIFSDFLCTFDWSELAPDVFVDGRQTFTSSRSTKRVCLSGPLTDRVELFCADRIRGWTGGRLLKTGFDCQLNVKRCGVEPEEGDFALATGSVLLILRNGLAFLGCEFKKPKL